MIPVTTFAGSYGTRYVGRARQLDLGGWIRGDTWTSRLIGSSEPATLHVTGPEDRTDSHSMYPTGYEADCGRCYLGQSHSEALHERSLEETRERAASERGR